jgi:hypothetical protein
LNRGTFGFSVPPGLSGKSAVNRSPRTANTILGIADRGSLIDITSGTFTQTFSGAGTLAAGWFVYLRNSGAGDITLSLTGSALIDGLASYIMYPGECRMVQCDGVNFTSIVLSTFYRVFSWSGTFVKPPGYQQFSGLAWGGGGGGGTNQTGANTFFPGGGGGGGCTPFSFQASALPSSVSVAIASGGAGSTAAAGPGGVGGNTTFGTLVTAYGGSGGTNTANNSGPGGGGGGVLGAGSGTAGGEPHSWSAGVSSQSYGGGDALQSAVGFNSAFGGGGGGAGSTGGGNGFAGGKSLFGGGGGGGGGGSAGGPGGVSIYGGAGGAGGINNTGPVYSGIAPGGGGGGSDWTQAGNGAIGQLNIWGVI